MLTPPVPIPIASYLLAYHLKSQDASPAPSALRAFKARNRQISNGRLYLPLLCFRCDCFRVFTYARPRAHGGATFLFFISHTFFHSPGLCYNRSLCSLAGFAGMGRAARLGATFELKLWAMSYGPCALRGVGLRRRLCCNRSLVQSNRSLRSETTRGDCETPCKARSPAPPA